MSRPPLGVRNNNPGNLRFANQAGAVVGEGDFARFNSYEEGVAALDAQLNLYYTGRSVNTQNGPVQSIEGIISIYAPPNENNTESYINTVSQNMGLSRTETIPPERLAEFREEIIRVELGIPSEEARQLAEAYNGVGVQGGGGDPEGNIVDQAQQGLTNNAVAQVQGIGGNTTPTRGATGGLTGRGVARGRNAVTFQPNTLGDYDNPSYYIRFFMISEIDEVRVRRVDPLLNVLTPINKVIIAETGATAINIESLDIKTAVGPNPSTNLVNAVEFNLKVFEPMGLTFYNKLLGAARDLGVLNFQKAPYYLELKFHGYDEKGNYVDNIGPNGSKRWLYKVLITNIQSEFTKAGTVYNITLVQSNDLGTTDNFFALDANFNVEGSTVRDIFNKVIEHKVKSENDTYGYQRNEYKFVIENLNTNVGDINLASLGVDTNPELWTYTEQNPDRSRNAAGTDNQETDNAHMAKGNTIANLVEQIFSATKEGHALTRRNISPGRYGGETEFIIVPWVTCEVEIRQTNPIYDVIVRDYNRIITYHIRLYLTSQGTASPDQTRRPSSEKFAIRTQTGRLVKKYDYLFTGENTEVLEVDFKFDTFFKSVIPLFDGLNDSNLHRRGEAVTQLEVNAEITRRRDELLARRRSLEGQINNQSNYSVDEIRAGQELIKVNRELAEIGGRLPGVRAEGSIEAQRIAIERRVEQINGERFAEDLQSFQNNMYTVTIDRSIKESGQEGLGNIDGDPATQSLTVAVLNQVKDKAMVEINLEIRGDPYWLGSTNLEEDFFTSTNVTNNIARYNDGNMYFILKALIPQGIDEVTGEPILSRNEAFTGIYLIKYVHHKFNKGNFTQTLEAIRDVNIDFTQVTGI